MPERYPQLPGLEDQPALLPDPASAGSPDLYIAYCQLSLANPRHAIAIRQGDFYECYGPTAIKVAQALTLPLSDRTFNGQLVVRCRLPFHSIEKYVGPLLAKGISVALCDEPPEPHA